MKIHKHRWVSIKPGYPQKICMCGELKVGTNTVLLGDLVRYSSTKLPTAIGQLGMDLATGRAQQFVGGAAQAIANLSDITTTRDFPARLARSSAVILSLDRYLGTDIAINGQILTVPAIGLQVTIGAGGSDTINSTGADTGSKTGNSTDYYVYVSNASASSNPSSVRVSTVAPSLLNGVKYLGTSGNAVEWRFAGWIHTDSSGNIQDSLIQRFVVNYYNRLVKPLFSCPGYANVDTETSWATASTTYVAANGGVGSKLEFISNGEDAVEIAIQGTARNSSIGPVILLGCGIGTATGANFTSEFGSTAVGGMQRLAASYSDVLAEGYRDLNLVAVTNGGTATFVASDFRRGSVADPPVTFISAAILA